MRGAGWIRTLRETEAKQLHAEISLLELDLIKAANSKARWNLHEIAHALRWRKAHPERLEECLAAMAPARPATGPVQEAKGAGEPRPSP